MNFAGADHLKAARAARKRRRLANMLSLGQELSNNPATAGLVRFDEFARQIVLQRPIPRPGSMPPESFEARAWSDTDAAALTEHFNDRGFGRCGLQLVHAVVQLEASRHPFHPLRDYLDSLQWDGKPRISRFLTDCCGAVVFADLAEPAAGVAYVEAVSRAFFVSAIARIYAPGCKADCMLILEGPQGALKSQLLRLLATRDEWFSDSLPHNIESKDARSHLAGLWIVEMPEIAQFRRAEAESIKAYLSCRVDRYRPSYGRADVQVPRQCVFVGSTNAETYLHDPTGNRRFWPVRVRHIRLDSVRGMVDQLWAEAAAAYRKGEAWWLSTEQESRAAVEQAARVTRDPWHDCITQFVAGKANGNTFTTADILAHLNVPEERRDRSHETRVGNVLRELNCARSRETTGLRRYVYMREE
jgi:predicted P-loop ATPase